MMKRLFFLLAVLFMILSWSCNKKDYFDDSGTHKANYDGTMLQYIEARSHNTNDLFDTLLMVIKLAGMENTIANEQITFFAPTDPSIKSAIRRLNEELFSTGQDTILDLTEVDSRVWKKMLQGYIIQGNLGLVDFPQVDTVALNAFGGRLYQTLDPDLIINIGTVFHDLRNGGVTIKYQGARQLLYSFIPDISRPTIAWRNAYIATSNIAPTNGRLHVIRYLDHQFGFSSTRFNELAIEYGIKYNGR